MIAFMGGMPRSGSSLLSSLLRQHPDIYVSPTSDLVEAMAQLRNNWLKWDGFRAQSVKEVAPRIREVLYGMMQSFYKPELAQGKLVIDKSRAWPAYIEMIEEITDEKATIICPVRNLVDIVASFERLRHQNPLTAPHGTDMEYIQGQSLRGRVEILCADGGIVGMTARRITDAIDRGMADRLLFVPFSSIVTDPVSTCVHLFGLLGLKPVCVKTESILPDNHTSDMEVWGLPLHNVGDRVDPDRAKSKHGLPIDVALAIDRRFPDLQTIAEAGMVIPGAAAEAIIRQGRV
jgi:sulfotransferase